MFNFFFYYSTLKSQIIKALRKICRGTKIISVVVESYMYMWTMDIGLVLGQSVVELPTRAAHPRLDSWTTLICSDIFYDNFFSFPTTSVNLL